MVIRNLRRFTEPQHAHEYPLCSRLIADFERKEVLYLAGLFHDIAKGRGGDHSALGRARRAALLPRARPVARGRRARRVAGRAAPDDVGDRAEAGHHRPGRRRRLRAEGRHRAAADRALPADRRRHPRHEPAGVERVEGASCSRTCSTRRDACSPGDGAARTLADSLQQRQAEAPPAAPVRGPDGAEQALWRHLDTPYFQRHTADEIAWHARHLYWRVERHRAGRAGAALARRARACRCWSTCPTRSTCSRASAASSAARGLSILEAKIHTTRHGYALDTFAVHDPADPGASYRDTIQLIEFELKQRAAGRRAARAAGAGPREPAAPAFSAVARGADLSRRQGHALHPRDRRRRPPGPARADRLHARAGERQRRQRARSTRWASAPRTSS